MKKARYMGIKTEQIKRCTTYIAREWWFSNIYDSLRQNFKRFFHSFIVLQLRNLLPQVYCNFHCCLISIRPLQSFAVAALHCHLFIKPLSKWKAYLGNKLLYKNHSACVINYTADTSSFCSSGTESRIKVMASRIGTADCRNEANETEQWKRSVISDDGSTFYFKSRAIIDDSI